MESLKYRWKTSNLRPSYFFLLILLLFGNIGSAQTTQAYDSSSVERQLTASERIFGLVQFWSDVKYNFAYFDQVPELNWEEALKVYLPLVEKAENDDAYYRLLEQFCGLLKNVNTNIYRPRYLAEKWDRPALGIELLENAPVVVNRSTEIGKKVPLGAQITAVNQIPLEKYLEAHVYPFITANGDQVRRRWAAHDLLKGPTGTEVNFSFETLDGEKGNMTLVRQRMVQDFTWEVPSPERVLTKFEMLEGQIGYLTLNSFRDSSTVDEFLAYLPEIRKCRKLVIDLRRNMAGKPEIAYEVLKYFTDQSLLTASWQTREHRSANWAWGKAAAKKKPETRSIQDQNNLKMYLGQHWHLEAPDTIQPAAEPIQKMPIAVLVSNYTASGAEFFLVAADVLENFIFVGEPSFGDTEQALNLSLPGGGSARICVKRDTYPDGQVFVGTGVSVDVNIAPSIQDYFDKRDVVLAKAIAILKLQ